MKNHKIIAIIVFFIVLTVTVFPILNSCLSGGCRQKYELIIYLIPVFIIWAIFLLWFLKKPSHKKFFIFISPPILVALFAGMVYLNYPRLTTTFSSLGPCHLGAQYEQPDLPPKPWYKFW